MVFFRVQQKGLFRREMPFSAETLLAILSAKFPEGREPRRAVSGLRTRAGGDKPAFHHCQQESMFQQAISMNPAQFTRLKDTTPIFLQLLKDAQRCCQFFVWCRHLCLSPCGRMQVYRAVLLQVYTDVRLQVNYAIWVHVFWQTTVICDGRQ